MSSPVICFCVGFSDELFLYLFFGTQVVVTFHAVL